MTTGYSIQPSENGLTLKNILKALIKIYAFLASIFDKRTYNNDSN